MAIYTKKGDKGETSLLGGKRVPKSDIRVDAYGTIDELNSVIGVVIASLPSKNTRLEEELHVIQQDLFEIGSNLANPAAPLLPFLLKRIAACEKMIDELTKTLPELKHFILPGGSLPGAQLHMARTICRRAERKIVSLFQEQSVDGNIITYINRLSDLFFTMARYTNHAAHESERVWKGKPHDSTPEDNRTVDGYKSIDHLG